LFYEDDDTPKSLERKFPLDKNGVSTWSKKSQGMIRYLVWATLVEAGFWSSMQHYNPLID
jgi:predicted oxidoreductase (fatty acid repression mutant protein)